MAKASPSVSAIGSSSSKAAAAPAPKATPQASAPAKNSAQATKTEAPSTSNQPAPSSPSGPPAAAAPSTSPQPRPEASLPPPSGRFGEGPGRGPSDGFSLSKEASNPFSEGPSKLVDSLANAYDFTESPSIMGDTARSLGIRTVADYSVQSPNTGFAESYRGAEINEISTKRFEKLDLAQEQITSAQAKVSHILDEAVEAKLYGRTPISAKVVKKAEQRQEQLIADEGKLLRTRRNLARHDEMRAQRKDRFLCETKAAEESLLGQYGDKSPELQQHLVKKLRPVIANDPSVRDNPGRLKEIAEQCLKDDPQTKRLAQETSSTKKTAANNKDENQRAEDFVKGTRTEKPGELAEKSKALAQNEIRNAQSTSLGLQGQADQKRKHSLNTLLKTQERLAGSSPEARDKLGQTIDTLDTDSVQQTRETLKNANLSSLDSKLDVERLFGRDLSSVRQDLESQISRGGKAVPKAREALKKLDGVIRRSNLLGESDTWVALGESVREGGPRIGKFLGAASGGAASGPNSGISRPIETEARADKSVTQELLKRIQRTGLKPDEAQKQRTLARTQALGFGA